MQGGWRTQQNSTVRILVTLFLVCRSFKYASAVASPLINLQEVQFGEDGLTAGRAVDITALFSKSNNDALWDRALWEVRLLAVSSDLQWLFTQPRQSAAGEGENGTYALVFRNVTFPTGGQYALIFGGQLADGTGKAQAVSISTLIGVAGEPDMVHAPYQLKADARAGVTDIFVHSIANDEHQQMSVNLTKLVSNPAATPGFVQPSSSSPVVDSNTPNELVAPGLYHIALNTLGACMPGHITTYRWTFTNASTGAAVTGLQGNGADAGRMPVVVVSSNLSFILQTSAGPATPVDGSRHISSSINVSSAAHDDVVEEQAALLNVADAAADSSMTHSSNLTASGSAQQRSQSGGRRMLQGWSRRHVQMLQSSSSSSASSSTLIGSSVSADVQLPNYGAYLFVGEITSGDEVIIAPFVVSCKPLQAAPALPLSTTSSAGGVHGSRAAPITWIIVLIAIFLQQLLL